MPYDDCQTKAHVTGIGRGVSGRERRGRVNTVTLRQMWSDLHGKPWPDGMYALHHCDNPRCSNPEHIFPGSASDNTVDGYSKGRIKSGFRYGDAHHNAKLTEDDVIDIRRRVAMRETQAAIAAALGICQSTVSRIASGKRRGGHVAVRH